MPDIPYCGAPPLPGAVAWNLDPLLIAVLGIGGYMLLRRAQGAPAGLAWLGWAVLLTALISPLCNLSVALFSARVGQHMMLTLAAAPLIAWGATASRSGVGEGPGLVAPAVAFALALWVWHMPGPYAATFRSNLTYWTMHATLFGTALWFWAALRLRAESRPDAAALAALASAVQMGLLGALLTLAPRPLFLAAHGPGVTAPWGLSPLEDQQLGGLLMWVPGGLVFAAVCVAGLALALRGRPDLALPLPPAA